ncbi:MAG TPA: hypothetical protein VLB09_02950, partial [Nitrospiria bacterium]|nr:hypothetical protein [Nitrospiria bacterium]
PKELIPPPQWFERRTVRGWPHPVSIDQEPRALRQIIAFPEKETCLKTRDRCLANARACLIFERKARKAAGEKYGTAKNSPVEYPVSGGTCSHWPREVIETVIEPLHLKQDWLSAALAWHCLAGCRSATFRNLPGIPL